MISPSKKEAPRFTKEDTTSLLRFLELYEEELEKAAITDDEQKIKLVVKYVDPDTEFEWRAMDKFDSKNWKEFIAEVKENYPEALRNTRGALERLRKIKHRYHNLDGRNKETLAEYNRAFKAEWLEVKEVLEIVKVC